MNHILFMCPSIHICISIIQIHERSHELHVSIYTDIYIYIHIYTYKNKHTYIYIYVNQYSQVNISNVPHHVEKKTLRK